MERALDKLYREEQDAIIPHLRFLFSSEEELKERILNESLFTVRDLFLMSDEQKLKYCEINTRCAICIRAYVAGDVVACFISDWPKWDCSHLLHLKCYENFLEHKEDRGEKLVCAVEREIEIFLAGTFSYVWHQKMEVDSEDEGVEYEPVVFENGRDNVEEWPLPCGLCTEEFMTMDETYMVLMCSHHYHSGCILQVLESSDTMRCCTQIMEGVFCDVEVDLITEIVLWYLQIHPADMNVDDEPDDGNLHRVVEMVDVGIVNWLFGVVGPEEMLETATFQGGPREWVDGEDFF